MKGYPDVSESPTTLTARFDRAVTYARIAHAGQVRKCTDIPYLSHLLATASLVLEAGGTEDQVIAGLLHDVLEDTRVTKQDLIAEFGPAVASIVLQCSDTEAHENKPPWRVRKEAYIRHLREEADAAAVLVSNADKLHNARSILSDLRTVGDAVWERFNAGRDDQLWYYGELVAAFTDRDSPLADELRAVVDQFDEHT